MPGPFFAEQPAPQAAASPQALPVEQEDDHDVVCFSSADPATLEWLRQLEEENRTLRQQLLSAERRLVAGPISTTGVEEDRLGAELRRKGLVSMLVLGVADAQAAAPVTEVAAPCPRLRSPAEEPGLLKAEVAEWQLRIDVLTAQNERFKQQKSDSERELQRLQEQLRLLEERNHSPPPQEQKGVLSQLREMEDETARLHAQLRRWQRLPMTREVLSFMVPSAMLREVFALWHAVSPPKELSRFALAQVPPEAITKLSTPSQESFTGESVATGVSEYWLSPGAPTSPEEAKLLFDEFIRANRPAVAPRAVNGPSQEKATDARRRARERRLQAKNRTKVDTPRARTAEIRAGVDGS